MNELVDMLLELRFKLSPEGEIGEYASDYDNAGHVCDWVQNEVDLIMEAITK